MRAMFKGLLIALSDIILSKIVNQNFQLFPQEERLEQLSRMFNWYQQEDKELRVVKLHNNVSNL